MQQDDHDMQTLDDKISLFDTFSFFKVNWKSILGIGFAGAVVSGGIVTTIPQQYEAHALVEVAQIRNGNNTGNSVEIPVLLIERLKSPSTYTPETIKACGLEDQSIPAEAMAGLVKTALPKSLSTMVEITVRRNSPDLAKQCMGGLFEMIRNQHAGLMKPYQDEMRNTLSELQSRLRENQAFVSKMDKAGLYQVVYLAKQDKSIYLTQQIDDLERALSRDGQTRLVSPIYASPKPVYPKRASILALGAMAGLILGLLVAIGRYMIARWRLGTVG